MSETKGDVTAATANDPGKAAPGAVPQEQLTDLMATGAAAAAAAPATKGPDLDQQALRAAEAAIADGERALAAARAHLTPAPASTQRRGTSRRELALRLLLAANVLAMIVVAALPAPGGKAAPANQPEVQKSPVPAASEQETTGPRLDDKYLRAMMAVENKDYASAVALLEQYLAESPGQGRQLNVLMMLAHYSNLTGKFAAAREYERRAQSLAQSHSLPEDLVAMAKTAAVSGDQDQLRRVWARFLLQQRQIPSSLYQHVAEAYLQLGDSYRHEANAAAEQARLRELQATSARVRDEASRKGGK